MIFNLFLPVAGMQGVYESHSIDRLLGCCMPPLALHGVAGPVTCTYAFAVPLAQSLTFLDVSLNRLKAVPEGLSRLTQLRQLSVFAAFSHSLRNEGSSTVRVLGQLSMDAPDLHLHAEEVLMGLVKIRKKQLKQAAAQAAASEELDEPAAAATNVLAWYRT